MGRRVNSNMIQLTYHLISIDLDMTRLDKWVKIENIDTTNNQVIRHDSFNLQGVATHLTQHDPTHLKEK